MTDLQSTPNRTCMIDGEEFLFFSGYAYLGMGYVKEFIELIKEGIDKYGLLFPSSRISNTRLPLYEAFEKELSLAIAMEKTVSYSSGFLAGNAIAAVLSCYKNILIAPGTHPAVTVGIGSPSISEDFIQWSQKIPGLINASAEGEFVIICDSVNVLTSTIHDLSFLTAINPAKKVIVLIDNSHGIGLPGFNGNRSILSMPAAGNIEYIISYSLSKALNIQGGAVSCSKYFADKLRQHAAYTASTAINPCLVHAYLNGKVLYESQRKKLFDNITYIRSKSACKDVLINSFPLPVFVCQTKDSDENFYKNKIIISSFRYPYSSSNKIMRIVINALHSKADLDRLCSLL